MTSTLPIHTDHNGQPRRLGYLPPHAESKRVRASSKNISSLVPAVPQSQWRAVNWYTGTPDSIKANQAQEGACVAGSCAGANALRRWLLNRREVLTSLWYIYDQINGGQDNGAVITDAMGVMNGSGAPLQSTYTKSLWVPGKAPAGALMYGEDMAITITSSADAATAILNGWLPQMPIDVTSNFETFTPDGVAWDGTAPRSSQSNHSIYLAGLQQVGGAWYFVMVNDWGGGTTSGQAWGPFGDGSCLIPLAAIDNTAAQDDAWIHLSVRDPDSSSPIPQA